MNFSHLQELAKKLPTGLTDPRAAQKLARERAELEHHLSIGDALGAALEAGDVAYYAAKALANGLLDEAQAEDAVREAAQAAGLDVQTVFAVAVAKYQLRARPGNPKDDEAERAAAKRVLGW